jgi:hydrogenase 3 maturation protease
MTAEKSRPEGRISSKRNTDISLQSSICECLEGTKKLAVLGVGSILNSDDGAGVRITEMLSGHFKNNHSDMFEIYSGCTAPENFTGEIKRFRPDRVLVLDAADFKEEPGSVRIIDLDQIGGITFSSHMLPVKITIDYLKKEIGCSAKLLGIQPASIVYGEAMTPGVRKTVRMLVKILKNKLNALA